MKYMLLIYSPESAWTREEWIDCTVKSSAVCEELQSKDQFVSASPLHPVATATTVRVRNGQSIVTTGPFAETIEQLGGYFIIDVPNLDDAIAIASRLPSAKKGTVEIRPICLLDGLPEEVATDRDGTRYMLLCYDDQQAWDEVGGAALRNAQQRAVALTHQLADRHQYLSASPLHPVSTATSVRVREGRSLVTDGPFAETREFLGGFYMLVLRDLNEAISIAQQHPGVHFGAVEIRQLVDLSKTSAAE